MQTLLGAREVDLGRAAAEVWGPVPKEVGDPVPVGVRDHTAAVRKYAAEALGYAAEVLE